MAEVDRNYRAQVKKTKDFVIVNNELQSLKG